jgi:16S rRNA (guanine(1405)-N(7))-methyltransferase
VKDQGNLPLDELARAVLASPKYRQVDAGLVREIGSRELSVRRNLKEAVKATKNKLHQIGAVYFDARLDYNRALTDLRAAAGSQDQQALLATCRRLLGLHASTRERLDILDEFFKATLAGLAPIRSVLDLGCGLNPLAIPWMPLPEGCSYFAYDIYADLMAFLQDCFSLFGVEGTAQVRDIVHTIPEQPVDVALLLKVLPCLEQIDKQAGRRLLESVQANHLLITFPARSLGGRNRNMPENYAARFEELLVDRPWRVRRFEFTSELAFLVSK